MKRYRLAICLALLATAARATDQFDRQLCSIFAEVYARAISAGGYLAFKNRQTEVCQCCP